MTSLADDRPVVVVTGGGGGIGAAIATELGRRGTFVVTVDPLVSVDGIEQLPQPEETTAGRIVAAGGDARASDASVTDRVALAELFADLVAERGRLDAVVNVAGITRPTGFATGTEEDWAAVLAVHLDGYVNVADAALPIMAEAGSGRILGVTSGSGWRAADAGAYSCAKRAVAALTWQLGRVAPEGVGVNAISPIAMTRMVTAALQRARAGAAGTATAAGAGARSATGGLTLAGMPEPEDLGPLASALVGPSLAGLRGQVLFAGGSEVALVDPPRLLEVVPTAGAVSVEHVLASVADTWAATEVAQATSGGSNPRFGAILEAPETSTPEPSVPAIEQLRHVAVVTGRAELADALRERLQPSGVDLHVLPPGQPGDGVDGARHVLDRAATALGGLDAVVVAADPDGGGGVDHASTWSTVLAQHRGLADRILGDARWSRAAADRAASSGRPLHLVTLIDGTDAGGRSRAQAAAQLSRAALRATDGRVAAVAIGMDARGAAAASASVELVAHLLRSGRVAELSGAELVVGDGWIGLRSHPRPAGSIVLGEPRIPAWFATVLGDLAGQQLGPPEAPR